MSGDVTAAIEALHSGDFLSMELGKAHEAARIVVAEVERLRAEREALAMRWRVLRGAQVDMLNGRPDLDALEEIASASTEIDGLLTAGSEADR